MSIHVVPIFIAEEITPASDLVRLITNEAENAGIALHDGDVLCVCQKVISKAEGRVVELGSVVPSTFAQHIAGQTQGKDPRLIELILRESKRIVKMDRGHLIVETHHGFVCANAGLDESNSGGEQRAILLPVNPDASAERLRTRMRELSGKAVAVIVTDTFGRPWREGQIDVALGVAGMDPVSDLRGEHDRDGRELHHTILATADALAAAAGLVMGKGAGTPAAIIRGASVRPASGGRLIRPSEADLFR